VVRKHVLRNALLPVVTMLGMDIGVAMGGTLFVENVFGLPGLGKMMTRGLQTYDLPVLLGVVVVMTFSIVILNVLVDICYTLCDPRVRARASIDEDDVVKKEFAAPKPSPARVPA
jgi:peptide/nickel transport system permease protein